MISNPQIIPAILATTEAQYKDKLKKIEESGIFEDGWIQIDLMDNKFVQNKSIGLDVMAKYPTSLKKEAQLMVDYPQNWIDDLVKVGVERIVFPIEDGSGIKERIDHIKNHGVQAGLSINPETEVEKVRPFAGTIDLVLLMSVHPGFGGQQFLQGSLEKIRELVNLRRDSGANFLIEVDGGINEEVAKKVALAGADNLVIGSYLIDGDIAENLEKIWESVCQ